MALARVTGLSDDKIFTIAAWLGVNENPDGDTGLKSGEASIMANFKITQNRKLQKRPGSQNVANILFESTFEVSEETTTILVEETATTASFVCYPTLSVSEGGLATLSGAPVTVTYANVGSYAHYYYQDQNGLIYQLGTCVYENLVVGGVPYYMWQKWNCIIMPQEDYTFSIVVTDTGTRPLSTETPGYSYGYFSSGNARTGGPYITVSGNNPGTVYSASGATLTSFSIDANGSYTQTQRTITSTFYTYIYSRGWTSFGYVTGPASAYPDNGVQNVVGNPYWFDSKTLAIAYSWNFYPVTIVVPTDSGRVQGIWAGRIGDAEVLCAACNGRLWKLTISESGNWTKEVAGALNTEQSVHFFGFGGKLYILNGVSYSVWDGVTLSIVDGYRPLLLVAALPTGGGTALERINMLNGKRRVRFSPTGSAVAFVLPEKMLSSIDYVKNLATGTDYTAPGQYTAELTAGTVTFTATPAAGTNTLEIGYSCPTTFRATLDKMTRAELYNGENDNRVFIYGDGSNNAYYSDLEDNGQPTAEYFPDLNVVSVGDSNTPLYDLLRHYNALIAFKDGSAHRIKSGQITLASGILTAAFYVETINKGIGGSGYGQAQLVENSPRTLDGRSIYEWSATVSGLVTSDQRNAQRISQKVETTLRALDLPKAMTFYDKINHEYYVVENSIAIVQNTENSAWYIYRNFPAANMIVYKDEVYFGTPDGYIRHLSRAYLHDCGAPITCYWESGSMAFNADAVRKNSPQLWLALSPEASSEISVSVKTKEESDPKTVSYTDNTDVPEVIRLKLKAKNFTYYKLIFRSASPLTTATITSAHIQIFYAANVK